MSFELVLERDMDASGDKLWRCWTEPALLEQWFCPKPWFVTDAVLDLRPGGLFSCIMNGPDGEKFPSSGVFLLIEHGKRIMTTDAFKPGWRPSERAFMVSDIQFEPLGKIKTRYMAKALHWSEQTMKEHEAMGFHEGWGKAADQLEALASSL